MLPPRCRRRSHDGAPDALHIPVAANTDSCVPSSAGAGCDCLGKSVIVPCHQGGMWCVAPPHRLSLLSGHKTRIACAQPQPWWCGCARWEWPGAAGRAQGQRSPPQHQRDAPRRIVGFPPRCTMPQMLRRGLGGGVRRGYLGGTWARGGARAGVGAGPRTRCVPCA